MENGAFFGNDLERGKGSRVGKAIRIAESLEDHLGRDDRAIPAGVVRRGELGRIAAKVDREAIVGDQDGCTPECAVVLLLLDLESPLGKRAQAGKRTGTPSLEGLGDRLFDGLTPELGEERENLALRRVAGGNLRPEIAVHEFRQARIGLDDVEDCLDRLSALEEPNRRQAQPFGEDLGHVSRHRSGHLAADVAPMGNRGRPGNARTPKKHRLGDHNVAQMRHAAVVRIVGDEDIAFLDGIAMPCDQDLHGLVQHADKGWDTRPRTDKIAGGIRHARADIQHLVDDRAHRRLAKHGKHLFRRVLQARLDDRKRERIGHQIIFGSRGSSDRISGPSSRRITISSSRMPNRPGR